MSLCELSGKCAFEQMWTSNKMILQPKRIFQSLRNCKTPHRLHTIHPALFVPPPLQLRPVFSGRQLFAQTAAWAIHRGRGAIKKIKPMLCFSWSVAISTCNPLSQASPIFYLHTQQLFLRRLHTFAIKTSDGKLAWRIFFFLSLKIKAENCSDMAPLDLGHYWGHSWEEPSNLHDLLAHRFFPYLLQWRHAATQRPAGVTVAFRGGLNRAEVTPCATSTNALTRHTAYMLSQTYPHSVHACSCSLLSQHTAGVRWSVIEASWVGPGGGEVCRLKSTFSIVSAAPLGLIENNLIRLRHWPPLWYHSHVIWSRVHTYQNQPVLICICSFIFDFWLFGVSQIEERNHFIICLKIILISLSSYCSALISKLRVNIYPRQRQKIFCLIVLRFRFLYPPLCVFLIK